MPFDPKLIQADDPPLAADGDLNLPAHLSHLAEQLSDDAAHLAARYPPAAAVQARSASEGFGRRNPSTRRFAPAALIATALAACLAGFSAFWQSPKSSLQERVPLPSEPSRFVASTPSSDTAISLTELSTPELEALLDLTERSPENALRISF